MNKENFDNHFSKQENCIYDQEEKFIFLLYQAWDGNSDNQEYIKHIRTIAKRGLKTHKKAIEIYWKQYTYESDWKTINDIQSPYTEEQKGSELYITLSDLIKITPTDLQDDKFHFWKSISEDDDQQDTYREKFGIRNTTNTLRTKYTI